MTVKKFLAGFFGTNCYLLANEECKEAVIVDPASLPEQMDACIRQENWSVRAVLLTHAHFDHIMGIDEVLGRYGRMPVYVHEEDLRMLEDAELNLSQGIGSSYTYRSGIGIHDGETLSLAGIEFRVFHTPGHTPGSVCYYVERERVLLSGDTLFQDSVGRTDFPGGDMQELCRSIEEKLFVLPDEVHVYPGHMGTTTIGHEKVYNPFVG